MKRNMKDMPDEFFLPPQSDDGLRKETRAILLGCTVFIVVLALIVSATQGIVISVG